MCPLELWLAHMFPGAIVHICVRGALVCMCPWSHGPIEQYQSDHGHLGRLQCELVRGTGSRQCLSLISGDSGLPRLGGLVSGWGDAGSVVSHKATALSFLESLKLLGCLREDWKQGGIP